MNWIAIWTRTAIATACIASASVAQAALVTFDTLPGPNGTPFTTITEDGVTVNALTGVWGQAFNVGNPTPGLYTFSDAASLEIVTGGTFGFVGFDVSTGGVFTPDYVFQGFLSGISQYSFSGNPNTQEVFTSIVNALATTPVDRVVISYTLTNTSGNIDNIRTRAVPEPGTLAILAAGLGLVLARRRARTA